MATTQLTATPVPDHLIACGPIGDLSNETILSEHDPEVRDIVVFGPLLLNRGSGAPWTIGMKGYRWSTHTGQNPNKPLDPSIAHQFAKDRIRCFRAMDCSMDAQPIAPDSTPMDVNIKVPTLLVVVSHTPNLTFSDVPISAKIDFKHNKFGRIDPYCSRHPKLWKYDGGDLSWAVDGPTVLSWISSYDEAIHPKTNEAHNYHMILASGAINTVGDVYDAGKPLPIIFDPGNNNGGVGNDP